MKGLSWTGTMADIWKGTRIPVILVREKVTLKKIDKKLEELLKVPPIPVPSKYRKVWAYTSKKSLQKRWGYGTNFSKR